MLALAACGSSGSSSSSSTSESEPAASSEDGGSTETTSWSSSAQGKEVAKTVEELYEGNYEPPPTSGPPAQEGKDVWYISCGEIYEPCSYGAKEFKKAGEKLGWNVTVVDSKYEAALYTKFIRQAIAAGADGIAEYTMDCPQIKSALEEAKAAGVPVVNFSGLDCNYKGFGGGESLFARTEYTRHPTFEGWGEEYATDRADVLASKMEGEGEVINLEITGTSSTEQFTRSFKARLEELCPDCTYVGVPFTFAQVASGKATQVWQAAIQSHPNAEYLSNGTDSLMALGLASAISGSGRELWVMGGEAAPPNLAYIEEGIEGAGLSTSNYTWQAWGLADTLNRVFAGTKEFPDEGGGWILVDETERGKENLPPKGQQIEPTIDFRAAFEKVWSGQGE